MSLNGESGFKLEEEKKPPRSGLDIGSRFEKSKPKVEANDNPIEEQPKPKRKRKKKNEYKSTDTPTYTPAHARNPNRKERKSERLQLSVTPSTKERFAKYAADNDTSMNEIVQCLIDQFLNDSGY